MEPVLEVDHVHKRYGDVVAVDDLSFAVPAGTVFGLLGPNGAGKTTTLEMIEGLRRPDAGRIRVLGHDVRTQARAVKARVGIQLQSSSFLDLLTVRETVDLVARLYPRALPRPALSGLIARLGLDDKAASPVGRLSGGQRQRLAVALALVNDPAVVFLDEPTAGLDPQSRRAVWEMVREWRAEGRTVVLTTHYMDEAEALADRLVIIDRGRIVAEGPPRELVARHLPQSVVELEAEDGVPALRGVRRVEAAGGLVRLYTDDVNDTLVDLVDWSRRGGRVLRGLSTRSATLEDLFLALTGHSLRD
ncbi:MAG: ABC transporter ATP-binding protein [Actinomycetia bacterium]|nr:ABC transporter ATP-binding protein [Actinomycetes bacterium]